jgi:hypothetical protein
MAAMIARYGGGDASFESGGAMEGSFGSDMSPA